MSQYDELKSRIEARRKQLEADLAKAKADAHGKSNKAVESIEKKLGEIKESLSNGWENLEESVIKNLNDWLK